RTRVIRLRSVSYAGQASRERQPVLRHELLGKHQHIPRPRHIRPVAVEISYQSFHIRPLDRTIERGLIRELIHRLMQRRLGGAPAAPCLHGAERFHGIRQMFARIPGVERLALGGVSHGGADDENGCGHVSLPGIVLVGWAKRSVPTTHQQRCKKWWARCALPTLHTFPHATVTCSVISRPRATRYPRCHPCPSAIAPPFPQPSGCWWRPFPPLPMRS